MSVTTFAAAQLLRVLPRVRLSRAVGKLSEKELPPPLGGAIASAYAKAYRVNLDEAALPPSAYRSFDEFFTRRLREGARRVSSDGVVSPADGRVESVGPIDTRIVAKGRPYDVGELIGDESDAGRYVGGSFAVVYLSPRDYHRVHSPVRGRIGLVRGMPGDLFPVNSIGERHVPRLFVRNRRVAICIDTEDMGRVTVVMVGAVIVGKITVSILPTGDARPGDNVLDAPVSVERGDEIGIFHLGSTAVLLLEPGVRLSETTGPVLYGESLLSPSSEGSKT